jgi:hypothetical protein
VGPKDVKVSFISTFPEESCINCTDSIINTRNANNNTPATICFSFRAAILFVLYRMSCSVNRFKAGGRCSGDSSIKQKVGGLSMADIIAAREKQDMMWSSKKIVETSIIPVSQKQTDIDLILGIHPERD